jgi:hypothetical protein
MPLLPGLCDAGEPSRVMSTRRPDCTLVFAAVAGEEQGLYGSTFLAQQLKDAGADVQGMFTNDIVGSSHGEDGRHDAHSLRLFHQDVRVEDGIQYGDPPRFVDFDYVARVAKVNAAWMWSISQAPAMPQDVVIDVTDLTNQTTLRWTQGTGTNLAGYEVVWRPTINLVWTHAIPVRNGSEATVGVSKDNVVFGVRSVSRDGHRSPAVFPFPDL